MSADTETGWLADLIYYQGNFESDLAIFADSTGIIRRISREPDDLKNAARLKNQAILPGLVNVHSHTFQRAIRARTEHRTTGDRDTFWTWREAMYHAAERLSPGDIYVIALMAFLEMLLSGITTVGEFHYLHHGRRGDPYVDRNLLAHHVLGAATLVGLRIVLLRTAYARSGWNKPPNPGQARFITPHPADFIADTEALRSSAPLLFPDAKASVAVAPHSVRALPLDYIREVASYARVANLPLHMHVSEQPDEILECLAEHGVRPVELLRDHGVVDARFTGIHAIHVTEAEVQALGNAGARVCACPTSERNLGDGAVPADRLMENRVGICFGSDSNIQIDLLEDARLLEYHLRMTRLERAVLAPPSGRGALAQRLFESATETGAAALGTPVGTLEIGKAADFFTVDLNDPSLAGADPASLLNHIVFALERTAIREVCVAGEMLIHDGRHAREEEIVQDFSQLQRRLWMY
ncbi:MAG: formimidoylglutamate deiminase [Bryobacteraceae bacterium]